MKKSILLIPKLKNDVIIEDIRKKHDPLFGKVPPHITLIFPFSTDLDNAVIIKHLENCLAKFSNIEISLSGFSYHENGYIFWDVIDGRQDIINLHDELYTGILSPFKHKTIKYNPHITIGHIETKQSMDEIKNQLNKINIHEKCKNFNIILEEIQADDNSKIIKYFSF